MTSYYIAYQPELSLHNPIEPELRLMNLTYAPTQWQA